MPIMVMEVLIEIKLPHYINILELLKLKMEMLKDKIHVTIIPFTYTEILNTLVMLILPKI